MNHLICCFCTSFRSKTEQTHTYTHTLKHIHLHTHTHMVQYVLQLPNTHTHICESLKANSFHPILTQLVFFCLKEQVRTLPLSLQTSLRRRDEACAVLRLNEDRKAGGAPVWFHWCTCKMYGFAFSPSPFICVSLPRLSRSLSLHAPASWLGCLEKTAVLAAQDYCQLKVLMVYSCRTDSALSVLPPLRLHPSAFSYFSLSLTDSFSSPPASLSPPLSGVQQSGPAIDLYVIPSLPVQHGAFSIQAKPSKQHTIRSQSNRCKELSQHSAARSTSHLCVLLLAVDVRYKETLTHLFTAIMTSAKLFMVSCHSDFHVTRTIWCRIYYFRFFFFFACLCLLGFYKDLTVIIWCNLIFTGICHWNKTQMCCSNLRKSSNVAGYIFVFLII